MQLPEKKIEEPLLVRACRRKPVPRVPAWIMRQAGRCLPEYLEVRRRADFLEICKTPALAAEVTLQPVRRLGVDAAILFSDILIPVEPMGLKVTFDPGPVLDRAIRTAADVKRLRVPKTQEGVAFVPEAIALVRRELPADIAMIGFAGAPFTLANYLIEGAANRDNIETKRLLAREPAIAHTLLEKLSEMTIAYLRAQAEAGAQVLQLFESSGVLLGPDDFAEFALPYANRVFAGLADLDVPLIYFPRGAGAFLEILRDCAADVIGLDWQTPIATARARLGKKFAIQGNLDPAALLAPIPDIERRIAHLLDQVSELRGYIFNLGHGILPCTDAKHARAAIAAVHRISEKRLRPGNTKSRR
ncbi:MAG: uroporphyrinogen decarboxylase [bacterium]